MRGALHRGLEMFAALRNRCERSTFGEAVISGLVTAALLIGVVWNMPDSEIKSAMQPGLEPIASAAGLDQRWQMYAPDPIRRLEFLDVHVTMADGTDRIWNVERGNLLFGQFVWYHWQKLKEQAIRQPEIRADFARWVVRDLTAPPERPIRVRIIFRAQDLPTPGKIGLGPTTEEVLYDETLTGRPD